jgi:PAS domain S-box-containing protein
VSAAETDVVPESHIEALAQLAEAQATLRAISAGEIDAFLVSDGHDGHHVFTLSTADRPYRMFVEHMRDGAATITADGLILYANERLAELLGVAREIIVGSPLDQFVVGDQANAMRDLAGSATSGAATECGLVTMAGTTIPVLVGASALEVDGAHVTCLTFTDLTEQRLHEMEALRREQADRSNRAKNEFLARMSHELRTPLNTVLGFGQLLLGDDLTPDQRESVGLISTAGQHLLELINDVLDISSIEAGALRLSLEPVSLREVVDSALGLMRLQADERKIAMPTESRVADEIYVQADRQRLLQVLLNLLSNAVKYNRPYGAIELSSITTDGAVSLSVADSGPGISEANLGRLFVPFERIDAGATAVEGTGLGLALSRTLCEAMGGTLTALSKVGEGSTFTLVLPAGAAPHQP